MGTDVASRLVEAMQSRDYAAIGACFAPDADLRALVPARLREEHGRDAIVERFRFWWDGLEDFRLAETELEPVEDRLRIRYQVRARHPEEGWIMQEQAGYLTVEDGLVTTMNTVCSGFRPFEPPS